MTTEPKRCEASAIERCIATIQLHGIQKGEAEVLYICDAARKELTDLRAREAALREHLKWALPRLNEIYMDEYTHDEARRWRCLQCAGIGADSGGVTHDSDCPYAAALSALATPDAPTGGGQ